MKKIITTTLLASLISLNIAPVFADSPQPKQFKSMVSKNKKAPDENYKFAYINMNWWDNFNDDILNSYIEKAVMNNYDLKMATLNVDEYYQNVRAQFASELPSMTAGLGPAFYKAPGMTKTTSSIGLPMIVKYEADIFLKNHDKTKSVKNFTKVQKQMSVQHILQLRLLSEQLISIS